MILVCFPDTRYLMPITYYISLKCDNKTPGCGIIYWNYKNVEAQLEGLELARRVVDAASDKQASNIVILYVRELCTFTDYFVICSGDSERQLRTILDEIGLRLKREGVTPHHEEGTLDSGWLLLDYGDVVVHIFSNTERERYRLEDLWQDAKTVLRVL
jgi:ribosome-associated protein